MIGDHVRGEMLVETVGFSGYDADVIEGYHARPLTQDPFAGVVVLHHAPGLDPWSKEVVRKFASFGYSTIAPHLYHRRGPGDWADVAAAARVDGLTQAMPNEQVMGDIAGAAKYLRSQPGSNGKVGVIGFCSGGRQAFLAACDVPSLDAAVDCWGGTVLPQQPDPSGWRPSGQGVIHRARDMSMPLLGIFGNDDSNPSPSEVDEIERVLTELGKSVEFYRYDGAGHAFFCHDKPNYRQEQAVDGWNRVLAFFEEHLARPGDPDLSPR